MSGDSSVGREDHGGGSAAAPFDYRRGLLEGGTKIGVWGTGHIGYSSMCHFAERGVRVVGVDVDPEKVRLINSGENPIFAMDYWLGFTPKYLYESGVARATTEWQELVSEDVLVHLVCIPTERFGKPYFEILEEVCSKLTTFRDVETAAPPVVIIESTLAPNTADNVVIPIFEAAGMKVGEDVLIGCAPRRDWFGTPDKSLRTLPRIIGGTDPATTEVMKDVLGIVCENLLPAPDHHHAEVVKSIENAYRHMEIALANELALAYPGLDVRTVLQLVGTKWNVGTFHPSLGVGGYCIPLASLYVLEGATRPEYLTLLDATVTSSEAQPKRVAQYLIDREDVRKVGILGLSYIGNVKVWSQSPTIEIVRVLKQAGVDVAVHDPHYTAAEIERLADARTFEFPGGLAEFDTVIVVAGHREYEAISHAETIEALASCKLVLDNAELWKDVDLAGRGIEYHLAGDRNWLGTGGAGSSNGRAAGNGSGRSFGLHATKDVVD
ncbi:MAG TPA: nucleotide sugar dehydrogenase [Actinomycetota bacterium]|nr:nucleotide sugar dehydrogenase [Actinomycetota bacterium]